MTFRCFLRPFATLLAVVTPLAASQAAQASTLQQIQKRGAVACGVGAAAPGFAELSETGEWRGFDADFCRALATAIFDDPGKIRLTPLSQKERLSALQSGDVDVLLRGAPWTKPRDASQQLLYAAVTFFGGQGFLAPRKARTEKYAGADAADPPENANVTICVQEGTAQELNLANFYRARKDPYSPRPYASLELAAKAYEGGECDLLTADLAALHALRAKFALPEGHIVLPELISKAPVGPIVRQGDDQWFNIVRWTHFAMLDAEELGVDSSAVDEALKSENPDIRRLLGVDGDFGEGLGLSADWAYRVIKQVGNYGEVFERNLGQGSPLAMERRLNALWTKGGLMYAPPVR